MALAVSAFAVAYPGPINFTYGDPWGNLLTAQAILEQGTIELDAYPHAHAIAVLGLDVKIGDHRYYFFPIGTSSTLGTALWSSNLTFVLNLATIWLLARDHLGFDPPTPAPSGRCCSCPICAGPRRHC